MTVKKILSVAKMAPTVYETETCIGDFVTIRDYIRIIRSSGFPDTPLNNGKGFSKISKPTERDDAYRPYHLKFGFLLLFSADGRLELGNRANAG